MSTAPSGLNPDVTYPSSSLALIGWTLLVSKMLRLRYPSPFNLRKDAVAFYVKFTTFLAKENSVLASVISPLYTSETLTKRTESTLNGAISSRKCQAAEVKVKEVACTLPLYQ